MHQTLKKYLDSNFGGLQIRPTIFNDYPIGIAFELSSYTQYDDLKLYMPNVYERTLSLFKDVHSESDELFLLVYDHRCEKLTYSKPKKMKVFSNYVKDKNLIRKLHCSELAYFYWEDDKDKNMKTYCYTLPCHTCDLKYSLLLKAICNQDIGFKPQIKEFCFFINLSKGTIFYLYDDRGLYIISNSKETLKPLYNKFNGWINKFEKDKIDELFRTG